MSPFKPLQLYLLHICIICLVNGYVIPSSHTSCRSLTTSAYVHDNNKIFSPISEYNLRSLDMRRILSIAPSVMLGLIAMTPTPSFASLDIPPFPSKGFQTKSGLKYFDLAIGSETVPSPRFGQLVSFYYTGYYRPDPLSTKLEVFDSSFLNYGKEPFLHKHGNGRILRGIDEALHTMRVGGKRRVIIPKDLGFTEIGVGPVPVDPGMRRKLGKLLDLVDAEKGQLVYDLELVLVADDENDQGYYDDVPVSQEEVRKLVLKALQTDSPGLVEKMLKEIPSEFKRR